jgi:predicted ATPase
MLKNITLYNLNFYENTEICLDESRLHVFVGQNNSGKTLALTEILNQFGGSYHRLVTDNLASATRKNVGITNEDADIPKIEKTGFGLASVLHYFQHNDPSKLWQIEEDLQLVVPNVRKARVHPINISNTDWMQIYFSTNVHDSIPIGLMGEGTILTLGILTVLANPNQFDNITNSKKHKLALLENVEQTLHPQAQRALICVLKKILQANSSLQIILSTHSPYIVDELTFSQVHVFNTTDSAGICCKRLDEHPDVEWANQTLTTGEFWDAVGEDWVLSE